MNVDIAGGRGWQGATPLGMGLPSSTRRRWRVMRDSGEGSGVSAETLFDGQSMYPPRSLRRYRALLVVLATTSGCLASTGPDRGGVEAVDRGQYIAITNRTQRDIYTFVVGRQAAALINWAPCVSDPSCLPLPHGATRRVPFPTSSLTSTVETEALVYWWHAVPGPDGRPQPGRIQAEIVSLSGRGRVFDGS